MKRRDFLTLSKEKKTDRTFQPMTALLSGIEPYTGPWEVAQVAHLLRRTMFGAKQEDLNYFLGKTMDEAVDELLQPSTLPDPPVNDYNDANYTDPDVPLGETWINALPNGNAEGYRITSLKSWWLSNIIHQERSLQEKMVLFWHNHIPTQFYEVFTGRWSYLYLRTLQENALGNFRDIVRAITLDPSMLHYLNGQYNRKGAPDENYARELQELFCIGKGPNAGYTEEDVQATARVLTGWRVDYSTIDDIIFVAGDHDTEDKVFSSFYGHTTITGRSGQAGAEELDDLLDMIFDNEETAMFLCRKIYRFFVADDINATVEANVIAPLADILRNNNYDISPVLSTLFRSQHFYDAFTLAVMLKSPLDFTLGMFREMRMELPDAADFQNRYQIASTLNFVGALIQQDIGDPPNVAGWPAYYQVPLYDKSWINTDTLPKRGQFFDYFLFAGLSTEDGTFNSIIDPVGVVENLQNPEDPNAVIEEVTAWLLGIQPSDTFKANLKSALLSGQSTDSYWTEAWVEYVNTGSQMAYQTVYTRLQAFFYYLLHLEEHQLA